MQGTGRGRVVAAVLAAASLMLAAVAAGASAGQLTVETVATPAFDPLPDPNLMGGLVPSPDGTMLGTLQSSAGIMRIDADGHMTAAAILARGATSYGPYGGAPTPLANGEMAFLADLFHGIDPRRMVLGTLAPGSMVPRFSSIPASGPYTDWDTTAIAPDGAVWRSLACRGLLSRTSPSGRERRIDLPPIGCDDVFGIGYGAAFAFGADGSVWFASLCQARIVRIPLVGPRREWRLAPRRHCERSTDELVQHHPELLATPDGGVRFEGVASMDAAGSFASPLRCPTRSVPTARSGAMDPVGSSGVRPAGASGSCRCRWQTGRASSRERWAPMGVSGT